MYIILSILIAALLVLNYIQYRRYQKQQVNLRYTHEKLNRIMTQHTNEKVLLQTDDVHFKRLLNEINRLLEQNQKTAASYYQMEDSMRKMLANISHDLRTPLTVVLGYVEMILNHPDLAREEIDIRLTKVHGKTNEVIGLMKQFFDLAKLEAGDHEVDIYKIDAGELCKTGILNFYEILTGSHIKVKIDIPEHTQYMAYGNEQEFQRVLNNLLSNAIQYGSDGGVIGIAVSLQQQYICIQVWDQGRGIDDKHQDHIFERMYTLEDSRNRLYQGSGLGLTITKRLVEKMGGEISYSSIPYQKTTFTVKLKAYPM